MKDQVENTKIGLFRCTTTCSREIRFVLKRSNDFDRLRDYFVHNKYKI